MLKTWLEEAWRGACSLSAPERCAGCGLALAPGPRLRGWRDALCVHCQEAVGWIESACLACGRSMGPGAEEPESCPRCRGQAKGAVESTTALLVYRGPVRALLARLKYGARDQLGSSLGQDLGRRWLDRQRGPIASDLLVVPVPLHLWRRCRRGFNQANEIARGVAAVTRRPIAQALVRRRSTPALFDVEHEARAAVVAEAFRARARAVKGRPVLLVDDIRTSGATLREAAAALRSAGAGRIDALVVGR